MAGRALVALPDGVELVWCREAGQTALVSRPRATPEAAIALVRRHGVTVLCARPGFFARRLEEPGHIEALCGCAAGGRRGRGRRTGGVGVGLGGQNVVPGEIERLLEGHPRVREVAVSSARRGRQ